MKIRQALPTTILAVLLTASPGCNKSTTTESPDGSVKVTEDSDTTKMVIDGEDGQTTIQVGETGVEIPETFPKDIPIPKGAVPKISMTQEDFQVLHLAVTGTSAAVAKDYQAKLKQQGWKIETTMDTGEGSMINATKEKRTCNVVVTKEDDGGALLQLTVGK